MSTFLHPLHKKIAFLFDHSKAVVVGGAVRDRLMGRPVLDLDISLPDDPESIAETLAHKFGGRSFPLDETRRIFRITFADGPTVDLAKWQGTSLESDLDRRDFSINALAVPVNQWLSPRWKHRIIDRHQGLSHLRRKVIEPLTSKIFTEDPLRLVRAFRIAADLDFECSNKLKILIRENRLKIKRSAPERIREELFRLLSTPRAYKTLVQMEKTGLLDVLFPEAIPLRKTAPSYYGKGGVLKHTLDSVKYFEEIQSQLRTWFPASSSQIRLHLNENMGGHPRFAHCKWALLLHDVGKPKTAKMIQGRLRFFEHEHVGATMVEKMSSRYRWSSDETKRYARLVRNHMRAGNLAVQPQLTNKAIHRFFRDLDSDAVSMLLVSLADHLTYLTPSQKNKRSTAHEKVTIKMIRRYYHNRERVAPPRLLNGNDVMNLLKIPPSPLIGTLLKELQEAQSEGKIHSKDAALEFIKTQYQRNHEENRLS